MDTGIDLIESRELLRITLASIGDGVIATDTTGRITFLNGVAESLTGWPDGKAVGQSLETVFRIIDEQTRQPAQNPAQQALLTGTTVGLLDHTLLIGIDGTERPIDDSAAPIKTEQGLVMGCVLVFRDVTDQRRLATENAERRVAERLLAAIVDTSHDAIISKSLQGIILTWNKSAEHLLGYTRAEALGRPISMLIPAERMDEETLILSRIRAGERVEHFDTVRLSREGKRLDVSLTISPIRDENGMIVGASKIMRDITREKEVERQLQSLMAELKATDQRKDEFLAMLAHELRNPLSAVRNTIAVAALDDSKRAQALVIARRQAEQLGRLVDDLLDVARITQGRITLRKERVNILNLVTLGVENTRSSLVARGLQIDLSLPSEPILVDVDRVRLDQVLVNVLTNAGKYTASGGKITIRCDRQGDDAVVRIRDTGIGIAPDMLPHVWDLFAQAERGLDRRHGGLGIGLTIARRIVGLHGGRIEAHSEGVGKGSEFVVVIPALPGTVAQETSPDGPVDLLVTGNTHILVVEDNADIAESLRMLLELLGHQVSVAYDGPAALEMASTRIPDVMLVDIGLPEMDGYEVARRARRDRKLDGTALIALTGYGSNEDKRRALSAGFDHHLVKPVSPEVLHALITRLGPDFENQR